MLAGAPRRDYPGKLLRTGKHPAAAGATTKMLRAGVVHRFQLKMQPPGWPSVLPWLNGLAILDLNFQATYDYNTSYAEHRN